MKKSIAVLISDIHYSLPNLELADKSMRLAISKANELGVPLIVAGDLHDTKANLRGECIIAMLETFKLAKIKPYVIVGNHDKINEKSEAHALQFLEKYVNLVNDFRHKQHIPGLHLVAYHHDVEELRKQLKSISTDGILIMHQGIVGSDAGEYIQDHSALNSSDVAGRRVISGHYHRRQDIDLPDGGLWSYIGNPFTTNYGEANDPEKGFRILNDDGSLDFVPTYLRTHMVWKARVEDLDNHDWPAYLPGDLLWLKLSGTKEQLSKIDKKVVANKLEFDSSVIFRLDLIPDDTVTTVSQEQVKNLTQEEIIDNLIESLTGSSEERKARLKQLWRDLK